MSRVAESLVNSLFNLPETVEKLMFPSRAQDNQESRGASSIPVDILDTPKEYLFFMDVPGLSNPLFVRGEMAKREWRKREIGKRESNSLVWICREIGKRERIGMGPINFLNLRRSAKKLRRSCGEEFFFYYAIHTLVPTFTEYVFCLCLRGSQIPARNLLGLLRRGNHSQVALSSCGAGRCHRTFHEVGEVATAEVTVEDVNTLVIRSNGKRKRQDGDDEGCKYLRLERRAPQNLLRKFRLPENANVSAITAKCENGVLTVVVEKHPPPPKSKTVEVSIA